MKFSQWHNVVFSIDFWDAKYLLACTEYIYQSYKKSANLCPSPSPSLSFLSLSQLSQGLDFSQTLWIFFPCLCRPFFCILWHVVSFPLVVEYSQVSSEAMFGVAVSRFHQYDHTLGTQKPKTFCSVAHAHQPTSMLSISVSFLSCWNNFDESNRTYLLISHFKASPINKHTQSCIKSRLTVLNW